MCLKTKDIDTIENINHDCYLTHPDRSDDTDDVLLDTANQLEMTKKDLIRWVTSSESYLFMDNIEDITEIDVIDFKRELALYG